MEREEAEGRGGVGVDGEGGQGHTPVEKSWLRPCRHLLNTTFDH